LEIHVYLILGGVLAFLGIAIFRIAALGNPFRGEVSVGPDAFQLVYDNLLKANEGKEPSMGEPPFTASLVFAINTGWPVRRHPWPPSRSTLN
jgi:hypothetical protein